MKSKNSKEKKLLTGLYAVVTLLAIYAAASTYFFVSYIQSVNDSQWSDLMRANQLEQRVYNLEQEK